MCFSPNNEIQQTISLNDNKPGHPKCIQRQQPPAYKLLKLDRFLRLSSNSKDRQPTADVINQNSNLVLTKNANYKVTTIPQNFSL